jgi:hypothetical protein
MPAPLLQIGALPNLLELLIEQAQYSGSSTNALSGLTSLTSLTLDKCSSLPLGITGLTALEHLHLHSVLCFEPEPTALLDAALSQLTRLTALVIFGETTPSLPASLSRLAGLQCLLFEHLVMGNFDPQPHKPLLLPPSLRWLKADWEVLLSSRTTLVTAQRLEHVCIADMPCLGDRADWSAFWQWASQHPPLRSLTLDAWNDADFNPGYDPGYIPFPSRMFDSLMWLRTVRPGLRVFRYGSEGNPASFLSEVRRQAP